MFNVFLNYRHIQRWRDGVEVELIHHSKRDFVGKIEFPRTLKDDPSSVPYVTVIAFERRRQCIRQLQSKLVNLTSRCHNDRIV
uniref:Uncharacterized protein n=1 Tax=Anopheles christyi TaxID=43041 RepID=A0A182KHU8_9DIPT